MQVLDGACSSLGVERRAAAAVGMHEGHGGGIGDHGTSYGPWQLHIGGALPARWARLGKYSEKTNHWAWSLDGIWYAVRQMAAGGASGKTGQAAVDRIVRGFEHPADPNAEFADAWHWYRYFSQKGAHEDAAVAHEFPGPEGKVRSRLYKQRVPEPPRVSAGRAAESWATLMHELGRNVPKRGGEARAVAARLHQAVK